MRRGVGGAVLAFALAGCATTVRTLDPRVAIRRPVGEADQGVAVTYNSYVCALTIHDESGVVQDHELHDGKSPPVDMVRSAPDVEWYRTSLEGPTLLMVLAMPPGRYSITEYTVAEHSKHMDPSPGIGPSRADCPHTAVTRHPVHLPFTVKPSELTLLDLPKGPADFDTLDNISLAQDGEASRAAVVGWLPQLERAKTTTRQALVAGLRQGREGYDVYPDCRHRTAVVRTTGTPFSFYANPENPTTRDAFRARVLANVSAPSMHKLDFDAGCVRPSISVYIADPKHRDVLVQKIGAWLVHDDLQGEIDVVVEELPPAP